MQNSLLKSPNAMLSLRQVAKNIGELVLLNDVTFDLLPNQITTITGDNGSGKSTLLKLIAGFSQLDQGQIIFKGNKIENTSPMHPYRKGMFLLWQKSRVINNLTVLQNINLASMSGNLSPKVLFSMSSKQFELSERVYSLIDDFNLTSVLELKCAKLSIGQKRLLSLLMSIISKAELLLLDEPLSGLSDGLSSTISNLIRNSANTNKTILMVEHNQSRVEQLSDQTLHLENGRIVHA